MSNARKGIVRVRRSAIDRAEPTHLLGLENGKRSTGWRAAIVEIGRPKMRVHDLRHTYASLARRAGADLRLLQKTMGHASITVTAHVYADLYDDELCRRVGARRARRPSV
jgi:integrase